MDKQELPKIDLSMFFLSISSAALMWMGVHPSEENKKVDINLARQNIELLELMEEKTKGNRTPDESALLEKLLYQTRMLFVETIRKLEKDVTKP